RDVGHIAMVGESPLMREVKAYLLKVAATDSPALITGETGTGKELVVEWIHQQSPRRRKPLVCLNCAAIPDSLLESELFGYEKGAFTGAHARKEGQLQLADGGTVFFDEIGDMSPYAQAKILRAVESKEVQRLGGKNGVPVNVRVIAATNRNLERLMAEEKFRADLYFRLNVAQIHLPPLRERKEDLPALCDYYIREMNRRFGREVEGFTDEAHAILLRHDWPGNVRELKNLIEATFINLPPRRISLMDLPEPFRRRLREAEELPRDERDHLLSALFATNWNMSKAAQQLCWSRMTLYRKMAKYHVVRGGAATS
ncbi:MAG: sigma-54 interaction domain-containing protein, partial [Candidatus Binatia bacterium]